MFLLKKLFVFTDFSSASNKNPNLLSTYPPRRTTTSNSAEERASSRYSEMGPGQKVVLLQSEVFGVTDEECQQALRKHQWDVAKSIKYLKVSFIRFLRVKNL